MTESIDELGPVDYLVVEFPGSKFNGEIMPELLALVRRGVVRMLDLAVISKNEDGSFEAFEFEDLQDGPLAELREVERDLAQLLSPTMTWRPPPTPSNRAAPPPCSCTRTFGRRRWPRGAPGRWSAGRQWAHPGAAAAGGAGG